MTNQATIQRSVQAALAEERNREQEIQALGDKFGFPAEAKQFAANGKTVADFRNHILAKSPSEMRAGLARPSSAAQKAETQQAIAKIKERRQAAYC